MFIAVLIVNTTLLHMKKELLLYGFALLAACGACSSPATEPQTPATVVADEETEETPRILVFSKTSGFYHESIPDGIAAIQKLDISWEVRQWSMMLWARYVGHDLSQAVYSIYKDNAL